MLNRAKEVNTFIGVNRFPAIKLYVTKEITATMSGPADQRTELKDRRMAILFIMAISAVRIAVILAVNWFSHAKNLIIRMELSTSLMSLILWSFLAIICSSNLPVVRTKKIFAGMVRIITANPANILTPKFCQRMIIDTGICKCKYRRRENDKDGREGTV